MLGYFDPITLRMKFSYLQFSEWFVYLVFQKLFYFLGKVCATSFKGPNLKGGRLVVKDEM